MILLAISATNFTQLTEIHFIFVEILEQLLQFFSANPTYLKQNLCTQTLK
jgi:hypothetical protein